MFSDEIKYQLDFSNNSHIEAVVGNVSDAEFQKRMIELDIFLQNCNNKKISLINYHECFSKKYYVDELLKVLNKHNDKEILVSAATSTSIEKFYNPLVTIQFWKRTRTRTDISWKSDDIDFYLFNPNLYKNNIDRTVKGIFSVRKENDVRNYLFSLINQDKFDGIIRYAKWTPARNEETHEYLNRVSYFPTFVELLNEYQSSYVSFIVESHLSNFMNPFTEKTMIAFLTKTMPIVLGGKNYVKELKQMGFYVWNDEFGFGMGDELETDSHSKVDEFKKCIDNFNKMSKSDISNMYNSNLDKIENNYKIISSLLFNHNKTI